MKLFERRRAR